MPATAATPPTTMALCLALLLQGAACSAPEAAEPGAARGRGDSERVEVAVAGRVFRLELALDPATRLRGLSGRESIPQSGGMLFAHPRPQRLAMVMRDCPISIDVAFLDAEGRVVALHAMQPEGPRRPDESPYAYEARLPRYASGEPATFAVELAGGTLAELGVSVGDRFLFDTVSVRARAR